MEVSDGWVVEMDGDVPSYFAPVIGLRLGHALGGWGDKPDAMIFAREKDAITFMRAFLPHLMINTRAVRHG